jgi:LmbE family N-acetylglucosaminyl deacetylase
VKRATVVKRGAILVLALVVAGPRVVTAQADRERGAAALAELIRGLGVTARVLMIGAHPDDEDTQLITWLARGRGVETAYLSLTRGDGGQNLIGNELGEALGVIRTEELLAARRIDGGRQYFTRAYDFGFSKSAVETYRHWPKDSILRDVVTVVRVFRPHVIVSVFSGAPRDGHGHHQVAGLLAREAYDVAGDTVRFPRDQFGAPWAPLKFYRSSRFAPDSATLRVNVGEYNSVLGRSYAEIAAESRSQHKSQGFGVLQRRGVVWDYLRREATRVNERQEARTETSLFDGIDTTLAGLKRETRESRQGAATDDGSVQYGAR